MNFCPEIFYIQIVLLSVFLLSLYTKLEHIKIKDMLVISTREFREKQGQYLGMIGMGEDIILKSRKEGSFKIVPITSDDTLMSKEAYMAK